MRTCRGCAFGLALISAFPTAIAADVLPSSGLHAEFHDLIDEAPTYRLRYLVPALEDAEVEYMAVADDMTLLCESDALLRLSDLGAAPDRIVITFMAQPVEFGVMTPDVRQFFESYSIENDLCIWEAF